MVSDGRGKLRIYEQQSAGAVRPVFVWNERYNTGLAEVDEQHRRMVDLINHVDRLLRAESPIAVLEPVLDELTEYAKYHFGTEERLMDELKCEPAHVERHKSAHADFARQVALMRSQASANPTEFIPSLLRFLSTWIVHHILTIDQALARQVFAIRGGAPLEHAYKAAHSDAGADPATEALLEALSRLYDDVARRNLTLADLNRELKARKNELRKVRDELRQANRDLEKQLAKGERTIGEVRRAFEAQSRAHAALLAGGDTDKPEAAKDVVDAILFTSRNLETVRDCVADLFRVIEEYEKVHAPSARTAGDAARDARDAEVLERLRRIVFEMLEESRARLAQAEVVLRTPPRG
jgi:hemerythrin-like metal-binding protein